ncbi:MAG: DUF134 domain-containing protein [Candidatus Omnitrophica bacterium]|nr:DUF134 domain-containing protein [Candidatus Omnitrophota bacterium]
MKPKGRPKKLRIIKNEPQIRQFSPRGKPGRPDEIELKFEEFEALRMTDFIGLSQKEAAQNMQISQQTFSRVLNHGRRSLAEALIMGKIIRIQGGDYSLRNTALQGKSPRKNLAETPAKNTPKT